MKAITSSLGILILTTLLQACGTTSNGVQPDARAGQQYSPAVTQQSYMFRAPSPAVMNEAGLVGR